MKDADIRCNSAKPVWFARDPSGERRSAPGAWHNRSDHPWCGRRKGSRRSLAHHTWPATCIAFPKPNERHQPSFLEQRSQLGRHFHPDPRSLPIVCIVAPSRAESDYLHSRPLVCYVSDAVPSGSSRTHSATFRQRCSDSWAGGKGRVNDEISAYKITLKRTRQ